MLGKTIEEEEYTEDGKMMVYIYIYVVGLSIRIAP